jgi:hypothetical protein
MEKLLAWLPERPQPLIVRYDTTAIIVAICFAVLRLVQLQSGVDSFFLMYPAVLLGALLFDRGSGFFTALLSTVLIVIFLPRQGGVIIPPSYWFTCHTILADRSCARGSQRSPAQRMGARDRSRTRQGPALPRAAASHEERFRHGCLRPQSASPYPDQARNTSGTCGCGESVTRVEQGA